MFDGVEFNTMQFVGPLIVLMLTVGFIVLFYKLLCSWLPKKLFDFLLGPVVLFSIYLWAIPMNLGFHTYFQ